MAPTRLDTDPVLDEVSSAVGRYVASRAGADARDDLVQETLTRLLEQRERLDDTALLPYGIVTARNLMTADGRRAGRDRRNRHRLLDLDEHPRPDDVVLAEEEAHSLRVALRNLGADERAVLLAHELEGRSTRELAGARDTSAGAIAVRLAASRAKLRVEYLLALRHTELPTPRCRSVLESLSAGDRRRQAALGSGEHLAACATCAELSEPLLRRRRALAAWWPLLPGALHLAWRHAARHPVTTTVTAAAVAGGIALAVRGGGHHQAAHAASPVTRPPVTVVVDARPVVGALPRSLRPDAPVEVNRGRILDVPADEGFWLEATDRSRIWVQLQSHGESPQHFVAGDLVSFSGRLVRHGPGFAHAVGVDPAEGAAELDGSGAHIEVPPGDVHVG